MFFQRSRKAEPSIDRHRSLAGIPIHNLGLSMRDRPGGRMRVVIRRPRGQGWLARFQPPVIERGFNLDELGTFVFRAIDGRQTVKQIIEAFIVRFRVNRREAELSTVAFLRSLAERGIISIIIK